MSVLQTNAFPVGYSAVAGNRGNLCYKREFDWFPIKGDESAYRRGRQNMMIVTLLSIC